MALFVKVDSIQMMKIIPVRESEYEIGRGNDARGVSNRDHWSALWIYPGASGDMKV